MDYLNLFLEDGSSGDKGGDGYLKGLPALKPIVGAGVGDNNELNVVGARETDFSDEFFGQDRYNVDTKNNGCDPGGYGGARPGDNEGLVMFGRCCRCWSSGDSVWRLIIGGP